MEPTHNSSAAPPLPPAIEVRRCLLAAKWDGFDTFTVEQAGEILQLGKSAAYAAVRGGLIESIRFGRKILIPRRVVEELLGF